MHTEKLQDQGYEIEYNSKDEFIIKTEAKRYKTLILHVVICDEIWEEIHSNSTGETEIKIFPNNIMVLYNCNVEILYFKDKLDLYGVR